LHPLIIFTLDGSVDTFYEGSERRNFFISRLVEELSLSSFVEPVIVSVKAGSVIVELVFYQNPGSSLTISDVVLRLRESARSGRFESMGLKGLTIGDDEIMSNAASAVFPLFAVICASVICFILTCTAGILAIKRYCLSRNENKVRPFVVDPKENVVQRTALAVKIGSAASSLSNTRSIVPTSVSSSPPDPSPAFRRVLPRFEKPEVGIDVAPAASAANRFGISAAGSSTSAKDKSRDARHPALVYGR